MMAQSAESVATREGDAQSYDEIEGWDYKGLWLNWVVESIKRLFSGDFSNLNGDFMTSILFVTSCVLSW